MFINTKYTMESRIPGIFEFAYEIPIKSPYIIEAVGAQGATGNREGMGGKGALMKGTIDLDVGDQLVVLAGEKGNAEGNVDGPSGGGASYVAKKSSPFNVQNKINIVYSRRNAGTVVEEDACVALLNNHFKDRASITVLGENEVATFDFTNTHLVVIGAPNGDYGVHEELVTLQALECRFICFCRATSRDIFNCASSSTGNRYDSLGIASRSYYNKISLVNEVVNMGVGASFQTVYSLNTGWGEDYDFAGLGSVNSEKRIAVYGLYNNKPCFHFSFWEMTKNVKPVEDIFYNVLDVVEGVTREPLIVAGGGGGFGVGTTVAHQEVAHAHTELFGKDGVGKSSFGLGGIDGEGGEQDSDRGCGGGGWLSKGGGKNGGSKLSGPGFVVSRTTYARTAYGAGGGLDSATGYGACGGGGGYSGGGGGYSDSDSDEAAGGGGGSINLGRNQQNIAAYNEGHGYVLLSIYSGARGVVIGANGPTSLKVRAYSRSTGELVSEALSDPVTGEYELTGLSGDDFFCVVLPEEKESDNKNALIYDKIAMEPL